MARINDVDRNLGTSPIDRLDEQLHLIQQNRTKEQRMNDFQIRRLIWTVSFLAALLIVENVFILAFFYMSQR